MRDFESRVVLITGGARGQGRSHAIEFASRGADVVVCDIVGPVATARYPMGTREDLEYTKDQVENAGGRCLAIPADVRRPADLEDVVKQSMAEFGRIDITCANAGIFSHAAVIDLEPEAWREMIDINLSGVFNTAQAVLPVMVAAGYGRIIATASMAGRGGFAYLSHYAAAKWGVIGFMKSLAVEVATQKITANVVAPTNVDTDMIQNQYIWDMIAAGGDAPAGRETAAAHFSKMTATGDPWVQPYDVTRAVLFLADEKSSMITGEVLHVAAGMNASNTA